MAEIKGNLRYLQVPQKHCSRTQKIYVALQDL
jgi:hypothetical protein